MVGLAAIYNENQQNEEAEIQLFYNTALCNLGMVMKGKGNHDLNTTYEADTVVENQPLGNILPSSQLAVARIQGVNMVVGVTQKPGAAGSGSGGGADTGSGGVSGGGSGGVTDSGSGSGSGGGSGSGVDTGSGGGSAGGSGGGSGSGADTGSGGGSGGGSGSGIALSASSDAGNNDISLVSPVYMPLAQTLPTFFNLAISTKGDDGWVYFVSGADSSTTTIQEASLVVSSASTTSVTNVPPILTSTQLGSYFFTDPSDSSENRYVIFQTKGNAKLYEYNFITQSGGLIQSTGNAKPATPIAVENVNGTIALYFTDTDSKIQRVYKKGGKWSSASNLTGGAATQAVDSNSQIASAVVDNKVHLYWLPPSQKKKFLHYADTIA